MLDVGRYHDDLPVTLRDTGEQSDTGAVDTIVVRDEEAHRNLVRATLIHNPAAGDGRPAATDLKKIVTAAGFQVRYQSTKKNWKKALQDDVNLIVAAGGDGTVAKVLKETAGHDRTVALLPVGTANNISRTLGVRGDARELAARWLKERPRPFDIGVVDDGSDQTLFVEAAGGGVFAAAIRAGQDAVEDADTLVGNETDRALGLLRRIVAAAKPVRWTLQIDGEDHSGDYVGVEVMNIRHAGPSVPIAPDADPGDGLLDVVMIGQRDVRELVAYLEQRLEQHEVPLPSFRTARGRVVNLAARRVPMRIDDKLVEAEDVDWRISLRRGATRVLTGV